MIRNVESSQLEQEEKEGLAFIERKKPLSQAEKFIQKMVDTQRKVAIYLLNGIRLVGRIESADAVKLIVDHFHGVF